MSFSNTLASRLAKRIAENRQRYRCRVESPQGIQLKVDGESLLSFCSNDYLGLANHPEVVASLKQAAESYGVGSGASHMVSGHSAEHHALEEELADFTGRDRALLFSSGYMANVGVINALLGRSDEVFEDRLNHASLLDGALLSAAQLRRYRHCDPQHLAPRLKASEAFNKLIVTDGVFSMDGDLAPLPKLCEMSKNHGAWLMVDDAHGFGCIGRTGGGCSELFDLDQESLPILVGTLGKAFGTFGAFVAGSELVIEAILQFARAYIYTTALPPAVAAATRTSLKILREEHWRREHLQLLVSRFKQGCESLGLKIMPSNSPIQPLLLGSESFALEAAKILRQQGIWVTAIRPPTVPLNSSRLRITFSASHQLEHVERLLEALEKVLQLQRVSEQ